MLVFIFFMAIKTGLCRNVTANHDVQKKVFAYVTPAIETAAIEIDQGGQEEFECARGMNECVDEPKGLVLNSKK